MELNNILLQSGGKRNINKLLNHIRFMLHNYTKLDSNHISKHNELIELFNSFKAVVSELESKVKKDRRVIKKLVDIIKKTKSKRILTTKRRVELNKIQTKIMSEHNNLKDSLRNMNIDIDSTIDKVKNKSEFKKIDPEKFKHKWIHVKEHNRVSRKNPTKKTRVMSYNRISSKKD